MACDDSLEVMELMGSGMVIVTLNRMASVINVGKGIGTT